jgi:hypothetical protein
MRTDPRRRVPGSWLEFRRQPPTPAHMRRHHARGRAVTGALPRAAIALYARIGDPYWTGGAIGFGLAVVRRRVRKLRAAAIGRATVAGFLEWAGVGQATHEAGLDVRPAHGGMVE